MVPATDVSAVFGGCTRASGSLVPRIVQESLVMCGSARFFLGKNAQSINIQNFLLIDDLIKDACQNLDY